MNLGKAALGIINAVAPTIATAIGGPVAGIAVQKLQQFFGVKTDQEVDAALTVATPDQLAQLRKIDDDFKAQMAQIGFDEEKLRFDDTASARQMQVSTRDPTAGRLAWLVIGGFLVFSVAEAIAMTLYPEQVAKIPAAAWSTIGVILGYLANEAKAAAGFYFGSSAGSQAKDQTLADIAKQP